MTPYYMDSIKENQKIYLAPMEDVTDYPFRQVLLKVGRPDVFFTEFVNVDGLVSRGRKNIVHRLEKSEGESPIILQLWGNDPEKFVQSVEYVKDMGFDGININLGCPAKKVLKVGCGSALILSPERVERILKSIQDSYPDIDLSVKTRLGFDEVDLDNWIKFLLDFNLTELILHGRTAKQGFTGCADWDAIGEVVRMNNSDTRIIGNGDIKSLEQAEGYRKKYGVDGVMIGREVLKNPWVFEKKKQKNVVKSYEERIETLIFHMKEMYAFTQKFDDKGWESLKKFYYGYLREDEVLTSLRRELFLKKDIVESIEFLEKKRAAM